MTWPPSGHCLLNILKTAKCRRTFQENSRHEDMTPTKLQNTYLEIYMLIHFLNPLFWIISSFYVLALIMMMGNVLQCITVIISVNAEHNR